MFLFVMLGFFSALWRVNSWIVSEQKTGARLCGEQKQLALDLALPLQKPKRMPAPQLPDKLFFAVKPPPAIAVRIAELREELCHQLGLRGWWMAQERLHITLYCVGSFRGLPTDVVLAAIEAGSSIEVA